MKLPNGKAVTSFNHEYKHHGTTTLFAALEVLTGKVFGGHAPRRRRRDFLGFMNDLVALYPRRELHVSLDNLNTHKPKQDRRLAKHGNIHLHFTLAHAPWLNQIECWFSILSRRPLRGASFTSPDEVRGAIDPFIVAYNQNAVPFAWTKREVRNVHPQPYWANLHN